MNRDSHPLQNELYSSWLYRQGAIPRNGKLPLHELTEIYHECMQNCDFDPDFDPNSDFFYRTFEAVEMPWNSQDYFASKSSWLIPRYYRGAFCYLCFCDHIRQFAMPTMLVEWCSVFNTVCPQHSVSLIDTPGKFNYKLNMAIQLFSYYHAPSHLVFRVYSDLDGDLMSVLLSAQSFMSTIETNALREGAYREWRLIQLIIRILLYPRYGIITSLFPRQAISTDTHPFRYNLHLGPLVSQVACRRLAILLTTLILHVLTNGQRSVVTRYLQSFDKRHYSFEDLSGVGRSANVFTKDHGRLVGAQLIELSRDICSPYLRDFISGFIGRFG